MAFPLSGLLYYDLSAIKHGDLKKGLIEYRLLLTACIDAIDAFESNDLEKFDSLVGENACQIRAVRIALIHANQTIRSSLKDSAMKIRNEITYLLDKKIGFLSSGKLNLKELLEQYELEVLLNKDELFLFKSFMLCEAKEEAGPDSNPLLSVKLRCAPHKLQKFCSEVSLNFAKKQTSTLRQLLAQTSVEFVQQTALDLKDQSLIDALSNDFLHDHNALNCLPMFWTYKALLKLAKNHHIPLIIRVKSLKSKSAGKDYFFKPVEDCKGNWHYELRSPDQEDLLKAACVIEGVASDASLDWAQTPMQNSIINAILAGAADHRQYPSENPAFQAKNLEYLYFKSIASSQGFSLENPSSFFIHHVYTSQVNKTFSKSETTNPLSCLAASSF